MSLSKLLFSFEGRIPRSTYWLYVLAIAASLAGARLLDLAVGGYDPQNGYGCATLAIAVVGIMTGMAVCAKRCHDLDRSGWLMLIALIPIAGQLWLLFYLGLRKGTNGVNGYGPDPLGARQPVAG